MTVIGANQHSAAQPEPHFIMEVRKAVSPASTTDSAGTARKSMMMVGSGAQMPAVSQQQMMAGSNTASTASLQSAAGAAANNSAASLVNQNLLSATIQTKGEVVEVKQQIPSKLAKLSLAGGNKNREKKTSSVTRPSVSNLQQQQQVTRDSPGSAGTGQSQLLPYKLSESDKKNSTASLSATAASGMSPKGYQKLSSSSFAEDRVGRPTYRGEDTSSHARTGSSPAAMSGRPMSSSNTLPKLSQPRSVMTTAGSHNSGVSGHSVVSSHHIGSGGHHVSGAEASPPPQISHGGGGMVDGRSGHGSGGMVDGRSGGLHHHHHHGPMLHRVNYSDSGEEVFFF